MASSTLEALTISGSVRLRFSSSGLSRCVWTAGVACLAPLAADSLFSASAWIWARVTLTAAAPDQVCSPTQPFSSPLILIKNQQICLVGKWMTPYYGGHFSLLFLVCWRAFWDAEAAPHWLMYVNYVTPTKFRKNNCYQLSVVHGQR